MKLDLDGEVVEVQRTHDGRLVFPTIPLHGFQLELRARAREVVLAHMGEQPTVGFEIYDLETNDDALAQPWLDVPARSALVSAIATYGQWMPPRRDQYAVTFTGMGAVVRDAAIFAIPYPRHREDLKRYARVGLCLASRPGRIADELRASLEALGMRLHAPAWRMDDDCVGVFTRGAATVLLDWRRSKKLITRLRAHGPDAPASIDKAWLAPRLAAHGPLVRAAGGKLTAADGVVTLTWPGMVRLATALAPAVELLCRLVAPPAQLGFR